MVPKRSAAAAVIASAAVLSLPSVARAVSAGISHSCATLDNGSIKCVGSNNRGQLGQGDALSRGGNLTDMGDNLPTVPLGGEFEALSVASGDNFNCAISTAGAVKCWGLNNAGQLGLGDANNRGGPLGGGLDMGDNLPEVDVLGVNGSATLSVESLSLGGSSACAVLTGGLLKCWGSNSGGQLGLGDSLNRGDQAGEMGDNLPFVNLGTDVTVASVALGSQHACAVIENGFVKCWGNNNGGQLGYEDQTPRGAGIASNGLGAMGDSLPVVDLGEDQRAIAVGAGFFHSCALLYTGDVKCWGFGESGQLGQGSNESIGHTVGTMGDNLPPIDLGTGRTAMALALGGAHTCAVLDDESIKCWGLNSLGALGLGDTISRGASAGEMGDNLPAPALTFGDGLGGVSNVFAGMSHSCVSGTEGGLACFGYNNVGQLGAGTLANLGDNPGEIEALTSIDFGQDGAVIAPASPGSSFNSSGTVAPGGSVPAPTPGPSLRGGTPAPVGGPRDADIGDTAEGDGDDDDGVSGSTIAIATSAGVAIFLFAAMTVCCCCYRRRKQHQQRRERELAAAAGVAGPASSGEPKTDKRVQFSKSIRPDEDVNIHPLLRGVRLDGIVSPTGTPTMTPGDSSAAVRKSAAAATPKARTVSGSSVASDAATAASSAVAPALGPSKAPRGEVKADSSSGGSVESPLVLKAARLKDGRPAEALPESGGVGATITPASGSLAGEGRPRPGGKPDRGGAAAPGGEGEGFPGEEKKQESSITNTSGLPPS